MSTIVLVESPDVTGSVGRPGFLQDHLRPMTASSPTVEVRSIEGSRCDIVAQRIGGKEITADLSVPNGLDPWYASMVTPVEIPATTALFIMSMADAVRQDVWRHCATGVLVQPPSDHHVAWTDEQNLWLTKNFDRAPPSDEQLTQALRSIGRELDIADADFVVFNTSTFVPGERVYWFRRGDPETTSIRAARTNLVVDKLAKELDLTLVDVDRVTAEIGAGVAVTAPAAYSPETLDILAQESIAVILDLEKISRVFASDAMQLTIPHYDRRTSMATLTQWHVTQGAQIAKGDTLFDLRFGDLHSSLKNDGSETGKDMVVSVVAGRDGFIDTLTVDAGELVGVGTRAGVITSTRGLTWTEIDNAAKFPVGIRVVARDDE